MKNCPARVFIFINNGKSRTSHRVGHPFGRTERMDKSGFPGPHAAMKGKDLLQGVPLPELFSGGQDLLQMKTDFHAAKILFLLEHIMETINWKIDGMSCSTCVLTISKYLEKKGLQNIK